MQREKCNKCSNIRPAPPSQIASFGFNKASVQCHVSGFNNRVLGQSQVNDCKRGLGEVPVQTSAVPFNFCERNFRTTHFIRPFVTQ
ncbi:hypothetical protein M514_23844 [Trichuris suis]|uniref:Uncharacterized protein n=1 Tax=Trichuris suis TaxID=68888 RepID=A0A085N3F0_9BILA|nr:hypothetical protein M514_23844 [Trichuris suis]